MPRSPWKKLEQFFLHLTSYFSTLKVGRQEQIILLLTMLKTPSTKLGTSKHG
jgi:hypothetical protein